MTFLKTLRIKITGQVQGVFFRADAKDLANDLGLTGWACNEPGNNISIVVQGPTEFVDRFLKWCHQGPVHARVDKVEVSEDPEAEIYEGFEIRY